MLISREKISVGFFLAENKNDFIIFWQRLYLHMTVSTGFPIQYTSINEIFSSSQKKVNSENLSSHFDVIFGYEKQKSSGNLGGFEQIKKFEA